MQWLTLEGTSGRPSALTPLLKQGRLEQAAQDQGKVALKDLQDLQGRFSGQPVLVLSHPHCKEVFPGVQKEHTVFQFVPLVTTEQRLNFLKFQSAHFCSLFRSLWMAAQLSGVSTIPHSFVS